MNDQGTVEYARIFCICTAFKQNPNAACDLYDEDGNAQLDPESGEPKQAQVIVDLKSEGQEGSGSQQYLALVKTHQQQLIKDSMKLRAEAIDALGSQIPEEEASLGEPPADADRDAKRKMRWIAALERPCVHLHAASKKQANGACHVRHDRSTASYKVRSNGIQCHDKSLSMQLGLEACENEADAYEGWWLAGFLNLAQMSGGDESGQPPGGGGYGEGGVPSGCEFHMITDETLASVQEELDDLDMQLTAQVTEEDSGGCKISVADPSGSELYSITQQTEGGGVSRLGDANGPYSDSPPPPPPVTNKATVPKDQVKVDKAVRAGMLKTKFDKGSDNVRL